MAIITISRLTGSGGREIATATANIMGFRLMDTDVADATDAVVLGITSRFLFSKAAPALHVLIVAPLSYRIARIARLAGVDRAQAEKIISEGDDEKTRIVQEVCAADWRDPLYYDVIVNVDAFSTEAAVQIIVEAARAKGIKPPKREEVDSEEDQSPAFAHSSEREFARVMDFYRI